MLQSRKDTVDASSCGFMENRVHHGTVNSKPCDYMGNNIDEQDAGSTHMCSELCLENVNLNVDGIKKIQLKIVDAT
uniref:Uncharacterized protein n=1 Tax=Romanomermis culicivorax TaxID=13658 RepID=A0A915JLF5_ROMCU